MTATLGGQLATILIPAYGSADKLRNCLQSLARYAPPICPVIVLDDGTPDSSIENCCNEFETSLPALRYLRSETNRGFVETCNWGFSEAAASGTDILLLNSDTEVTSGFLEEMHRVLYLHERHAVVTPRSNNATIFSIPWKGGLLPAESYEVWQAIHTSLPDYHVMPTAVGFCMLIKALILERFGLFDEIYSPGYNEENDFVCRINRCGYSAVAANHAFVFHHESSTFGPRRAELERAHSKILLERYPEYTRKVGDYVYRELDPVEEFAILRRRHRPRVLVDLYHLPVHHSGTSEFGLSLLRELYPLLEESCDVFIGVSPENHFFSNQLQGYRMYQERSGAEQVFDLVFKPSQVFTWNEFRKMNRLAPRVTFVLQDIIAVRCEYLASADRKIIFRKTVELADRVFTISEYSQSDFRAFYNSDVSMQVIYHGTNSGASAGEFMAGEYVLVMGNDYAHKGVAAAVRALKGVGRLLVVGSKEPPEGIDPDVEWVCSGQLGYDRMREIMTRTSILVYPSHYEGYGLPVVDALALRKHVVVLDSDLNRELARQLGNEDLHRVHTVDELRTAVERYMKEPTSSRRKVRRWDAPAKEYAEAIRELLSRDPDTEKLRQRWDQIRFLDTAQHP